MLRTQLRLIAGLMMWAGVLAGVFILAIFKGGLPAAGYEDDEPLSRDLGVRPSQSQFQRTPSEAKCA